MAPGHGIRTSFGPYTTRDSNAFNTAFVLEVLCRVDRSRAVPLDVDQRSRISSCRRAAARAIERFRYTGPTPAFSAYGYWPRLERRRQPGLTLIDLLASLEWRGPRLRGDLAPLARSYPREFRIWPDADTTATCYRALSRHRELEEEEPAPWSHSRFDVFSRYRDRAATNRYAPEPSVLQRGSGAFLTWFHVECSPCCPNEVDLVVNANVLALLGAEGRLSAPGVDQALAWIDRAIREGLHRDPRSVSTHYQHPWMIHAWVARAYRIGDIPTLRPAVDVLVREVVAGAVGQDDDTAAWQGQNKVVATMCACSALLDAGYEGPLLERGIRFLVRSQRADGSWSSGWIHMGSDDIGLDWHVHSPAFFSSLALDVLCRYLERRR